MTRYEREIADLMKALDKAAEQSDSQRFNNLVKLGVIDKHGRYLGPAEIGAKA